MPGAHRPRAPLPGRDGAAHVVGALVHARQQEDMQRQVQGRAQAVAHARGQAVRTPNKGKPQPKGHRADQDTVHVRPSASAVRCAMSQDRGEATVSTVEIAAGACMAESGSWHWVCPALKGRRSVAQPGRAGCSAPAQLYMQQLLMQQLAAQPACRRAQAGPCRPHHALAAAHLAPSQVTILVPVPPAGLEHSQ